MEFREFSSPEGKDYDVTSSLSESSIANNQYVEQLIDLIGILEDISEEELQEQFGISMSEYLEPNAQTIEKVIQKIDSLDSDRGR